MFIVKTIETQNYVENALKVQDGRTIDQCKTWANIVQNQLAELTTTTTATMNLRSEASMNLIMELAATAAANTKATIAQVIGMLCDRCDKIDERISCAEGKIFCPSRPGRWFHTIPVCKDK